MTTAETQTSGILPITFSPEVSDRILEAAMGIPLDLSHPEASLVADRLSAGLTAQVGEELEAIRQGESYSYVVGTTGLDIPSLNLEQRTNIARVSSLSIAHALGNIGTTEYEEGGSLLSLVEPVPGFEQTISYRGGQKPQKHHQEMLASPGKTTREALTKYVVLSLASNTTPPTPTIVASIDAALGQLPDEVITELGKAHFSMLPYDAQKKAGVDTEVKPPEAIIHPDGLVVVDFDDIEATTDEAKHALKAFGKAIENVTEEVHMEPGQTLVIDNHKSTHGRSIIHPNGRRRLTRAHVV
jgi:hypothetical protein